MSPPARQNRPAGPVPGFHGPDLDGMTLYESAVLLMAHARRSHSLNESSESVASHAAEDAQALMAQLNAD